MKKEEKEEIKNTTKTEVDNDPWKESRKIIGTFPEDFMKDRNQPPCNDVREEFYSITRIPRLS